MKVLFALSECRPYCASGGLADVGGSLPPVLARNMEVGVVMPFYKAIKRFQPQLIKQEIVRLDWRCQTTRLYHLAKDNIDYYFVDCPQYFDRDNLYGYTDDIERFAFFSRAVVELLAESYDIIHCHDWQTALIPSLLKSYNLRRPTVLTIHNIEYQGTFLRQHLKDLTGLDPSYTSVFDWDWGANLLKGGIVHCDKLTTVSPHYAQEIEQTEFASGLSQIIFANSYKLSGILNGIDCVSYNPSNDNDIAKKFSADSVEAKRMCKAEIQSFLGLPPSDAPLFVMVTRLASHKGLDIVKQVLPRMLEHDVQFAVLGTGDRQYEDYFNYLASRENFATYIGFDNVLARKMYAGGDFFVMPSKSEPCGLSQMIACRYGTVPIVRRVGGLADSINESYGILFDNYDANSLGYAIEEALSIYNDNVRYLTMQHNAMIADFTWDKSASQYEILYKQLLP